MAHMKKVSLMWQRKINLNLLRKINQMIKSWIMKWLTGINQRECLILEKLSKMIVLEFDKIKSITPINL